MSDDRLAPDPGSAPAEAVPRQSFAWGVVFCLALIDLAWIHASGWSVPFREVLLTRWPYLGLFVPLLFHRYRSDLRLRSTLLGTAVLIAFSNFGSVLSYLVLSVGGPLADRSLARWDAALGFDWLAAVNWVDAHPSVQHVFRVAYQSGLVQVGLVVLVLGFTARLQQLHEFIDLYIAGSLIAIASSLAFPAAGPWIDAPGAPFDASVLSNFVPLHDGTLRKLDLIHLQGLISVPSAHAMVGVFLVYSMRGTGLLFLLSAMLNGVLLLATPTEGGHYLIDVIAGILCAAGLIAAAAAGKSPHLDAPSSAG